MMPYRLIRRQLREMRYPMAIYREPPSFWALFREGFKERWLVYWHEYQWLHVLICILLGIAIGRLLH
jgi:hypothetical protein